jgi:hypothetical protein
MSDVLSLLRDECATVAERARQVRISTEAIPEYARSLPRRPPEADAAPTGDPHLIGTSREQLAAFWLTLDAINFGSGWFPTLHKRPGQSGYHTIAAGLKEQFTRNGPWSVEELRAMTAETIAHTLGQDPAHELMGLFARSLADLGRHIDDEHSASFEAVVDAGGRSAVALVELLAGWECFNDVSTYDGLTIPFLKRAQIAAADLARANVTAFHDLHKLTMFADNLVPHVLRLDGILTYDTGLLERIEQGQLLEHGSPEEVEIRACAVHAVELIVNQRPQMNAAEVDQLLWLRGQEPRYKARPRHRSRCTAY